jgi:PAS domain S-box-containing protein
MQAVLYKGKNMERKKSEKKHKNKTGSQYPATASLRKREKVALQEKAEEKLRFEEQRFRALVEHSSDIIVIMNPEGVITYVNPAVERALGFKPEERIGAKGFELIHPDDMKFLTDSFNTLATDTNSPVIHGEMHLRHKDGSWRTFEAVGSKLVNNNVVEAVIVNYRDITERKQAKEKLRHEEQRFRALTEQSSDIIIFVNREGIVTYENPAVERSLGLKAEERIGVSLFERIHPDDLKFAMDAFNKFTFDKLSKDINAPVRQIRFRHQDGSWRTFEVVGSKLVQDKFVEFVIVNLRDITERKQTEELLKESEAHYRLLADHMKDQVWIMDLDLKVTYISPSVEKLLGYTLDELKHLSLDKLLPATSYQAAMEFISMEMPKALKASPTYSLRSFPEFEFRCKDGKILWIESSFSFIRDENGKPVSILGEGRNITERKQMEYDLRASEINFRHSLDDSPLGVRISTIEGETIYANRAVLDIYGYDSIEELKKTPLKERYTPESYANYQTRKEKRLRGEFGPSEYEISIVRKNGEIRHLHVFRKEIFWNGRKQSQVVYQDITERRHAEETLNETLESLRKSIKTTIQVLGTASETRDPYTAGHQKKVADLARAIATEMKLPHDKIEGIRMAGAIHDIGKISIPSEILCKSITLSDLEFSIIKAHAQYSYEIIKDVESPWPLADIVYQHHERINGSGYPQGLKGENILMEARIIAVADVVEAMASYRPYRPSLGVEIALAEIEQNAGTLYDCKVADACLKLFREKNYQIN